MRRFRDVETLYPSGDVIVGPHRSAETLTGTDGIDHLKGSRADDVIHGLGGNDGLTGAGGDDYLDGGDGDDRLTDNQGRNTLLGGAGDDQVFTNSASTADGGDGFDRLKVNFFGDFGVDFVLKADGTVTTTYGSYANFEQFSVSFAAPGANVVLGDGDDVVSCGSTGNHVATGGGDDVIRVNENTALDVDGGTGFDRLSVSSTAGSNQDTFDDAAFFADPTNHVVEIEAFEVYAGSGRNATQFTLSTGAELIVHAQTNWVYTPDASIVIDASAFTHGVEISDTGIVYGSDVRTITFEQTTILADKYTGLSVTGSAYDDRIAARAADGGEGTDTLVFRDSAIRDLMLRDGGLAGYTNTYKGFEVLDAATGAGSTLRGGSYSDTLAIVGTGTYGSSLIGVAGDDRLSGGLGSDTLSGGAGDDVMSGGGGADTFVIRGLVELKHGGDVITDFSHSEGDRIDLSAIDPSKKDGDQAFTFIGDGTFSGDRHVTELRATAVAEGTFLVEGDRNHDGTADFSFTVHADQPLVATDFVL